MQKAILVVGDYIEDIFRMTEAMRLCPASDAPVLIERQTYKRPGGAELVAENIKALIPHVTVLQSYGSRSEKEHIYAGNHMLARIDRDSRWTEGCTRYAAQLKGITNNWDIGAVVVSDYGKGAMTPEAVAIAMNTGAPTYVDAKTNWKAYAGAYAAFPNQREHSAELKALYSHVIHKLGAAGCLVDGTPVAAEPRKVFDVSGAGDVFLAAFVAAVMMGESLLASAHYANRAAGISVEHTGTHVLTPEEVTKVWQ